MQAQAILNVDGHWTFCGRVGLFREAIYAFCGGRPGHAGACQYALNPAGTMAADTEPLPGELVEPVFAEGIPPLAELLRERRGERIAAG